MLCRVRETEIAERDRRTAILYRVVREDFGEKFTLEQKSEGE